MLKSSKHKIRNKYLALLVLFALAMNALLPSFSVFKSASEQISATNMVLICSSEGMKWIALADLQSGKEKPEIFQHLKLPAIASATQMLKDFANLQIEQLHFSALSTKFLKFETEVFAYQKQALIDGLHSRAPPRLS